MCVSIIYVYIATFITTRFLGSEIGHSLLSVTCIYIINNYIWQDGLYSCIVDVLTNCRYGEPDYF